MNRLRLSNPADRDAVTFVRGTRIEILAGQIVERDDLIGDVIVRSSDELHRQRPNERRALRDAQDALAAIRTANPTDAAGVTTVIDRVLGLLDALARVSVDTTAARGQADRMLLYWQARAAA